jgi:hypothetical protein
MPNYTTRRTTSSGNQRVRIPKSLVESCPPFPQAVRIAAHSDTCMVCGVVYGKIIVGKRIWLPKEAIDHLWPRHYVWRSKLDPHVAVNLMSVCDKDHGLKRKAEYCLWQGDLLGYMKQLLLIGWPMDRIVAAAKHFGFREVIGL